MLAQSLEWLMQPPNLKIQFQWIINSYFLQEHDMENNDQHWCGLKILMDWGIDSEKASWWVLSMAAEAGRWRTADLMVDSRNISPMSLRVGNGCEEAFTVRLRL